MKQYCRYCVNLCYGDVAYCGVKEEIRSESSCKRPNNCKDFDLCEGEFADAFGKNPRGYRPRAEKKYNGEQVSMI